MKLVVTQIQKTTKANKHGEEVEIYKCVLSGKDTFVEGKLTLEAEHITDLERKVGQVIGESVEMGISPLNHKLDEYVSTSVT